MFDVHWLHFCLFKELVCRFEDVGCGADAVVGPSARALPHRPPQLPGRGLQALCRRLQTQGKYVSLMSFIYIDLISKTFSGSF